MSRPGCLAKPRPALSGDTSWLICFSSLPARPGLCLTGGSGYYYLSKSLAIQSPSLELDPPFIWPQEMGLALAGDISSPLSPIVCPKFLKAMQALSSQRWFPLAFSRLVTANRLWHPHAEDRDPGCSPSVWFLHPLSSARHLWQEPTAGAG